MRFSTILCLAATAALSSPSLAEQPVQTSPAQVAATPLTPGLGVINVAAVIDASAAHRSAIAQRQTAYKALYDQAKTIQTSGNAAIQQRVQAIQAEKTKPSPDIAQINRWAGEINQISTSGNAEVQRILAPVALSEAYEGDQIAKALLPAIQNVMTKRQINYILGPGAMAFWDVRYSIDRDVLTALDAALPAVSITPPAGWQPNQQSAAKSQ